MVDEKLYCRKSRKFVENKNNNFESFKQEFNDNTFRLEEDRVDLNNNSSNIDENDSMPISQVNYIGIRNGSVCFPASMYSLVSKYISDKIDENSENNDEYIIVKLLKDIKNFTGWILDLSESESNEIYNKFNSHKYKEKIIDYLKTLIYTIRSIKNNSHSLNEISDKVPFNRELVRNIAKCIMNESEYDHYTNRWKNNTSRTNIYQLLDSQKDSIINLRFIPTVENLIIKLPSLSTLDVSTINLYIRDWLKKNTPFSSLQELKNTNNNYVSIADNLNNLLDSKRDEIISGSFIPNRRNLSKINLAFNDRNLTSLVRNWLVKNTAFGALNDLIRHFNPTPTELGYTIEHQQVHILKHLKDLVPKLNLDLPLGFSDIVITMYKDILYSINSNNISNAFDEFYFSLTRSAYKDTTPTILGIKRSEDGLAGILIYYSLIFYFFT